MFSIIIPLYNKELNIGRTLQSVINQSFKDFEIIIINDGSTDNSVSVIKTFDDPRIRVIHKENNGVSSARNHGIEVAKFDYIAFLDADDLWEPEYLEEMKKLIFHFPHSAIFGCNFDYLENNNYRERITGLSPGFTNVIINYFEIGMNISLYWTSAVIVRKKCIKEIGGFDERITMGEDLDLWFRIVLKFKSPIFYNRVLAHYNLNDPNSAMKKKHDFNKSILGHLDKFKYWENSNKEFSVFLNNFKVRKLVEIFNNYEVDRRIVNDYTRNINTSVISYKWKIYCLLPYWCKKKIAKYYN